MGNYRILVVDDEEDLCEILKFNLENEGYEIDTANSAEEALKMDISSYDLLLLDVMMGEISGFKMANLLKKDRKTAHIPIIFITAKDTENDTITGFNLGADDYISKPFSLREVTARVKAVLRRTKQEEAPERQPEQIAYKTLVLDIGKKKVSIDGAEAPLTKKEFEILLLLLQNKGRVFSREDILHRIWSDEVYVLDRTIDVNITRLRKKIGAYGKCIVTRLGYGYCFEAFLSVIALFIAFALCFIAYQYQREKEYKVELLDMQLQDYNERLHMELHNLSDSLWDDKLAQYITRHINKELRVTVISLQGKVLYTSAGRKYRKPCATARATTCAACPKPRECPTSTPPPSTTSSSYAPPCPTT